MKNKNAIILCSGGLDSVTTAYYIKKKLKYNKLIFLFFNYGQRTLNHERKASKKTAKKLGANFVEMDLENLANISTSLINNKKRIKRIKKEDLKDTKKESQKYYVPCRNTVFLVYALALAESIFIKQKIIYDIITGFKCEGKEAYPDTTLKYIEEINKLRKISTNVKGKIIAPLINLDKDEIVLLGEKLGVDYKETYSCYADDENHCGDCLACKLRQEAFYWANIKDPTRYKNKQEF